MIEPYLPVNRLLLALPHKIRQRFITDCEAVDLAFAEILTEPGERIDHVYFPTESFIALTKPIDKRGNLEVGFIGDEGMLGISLLLGVSISPLQAVVLGEGPALRMDTNQFRRKLTDIPALQTVLQRYLYVITEQLAQTAVCCRFHVVDERLARWLLMTHDRAHSDTFHITHEFLASMLGVRRVGITKAASALQNRELICYSRGNIRILDRAGLEAAACECYASDHAIYTRTMEVKTDLRPMPLHQPPLLDQPIGNEQCDTAKRKKSEQFPDITAGSSPL
ncbi:MAG: Crp/Fnr family transcriptional regulator [Halioglobus sp.]